jgi:hypothetical protein
VASFGLTKGQSIQAGPDPRQEHDSRDGHDRSHDDVSAHDTAEGSQAPEGHGTQFRGPTGSYDQCCQSGEEGCQRDSGQQHRGHHDAARCRCHAVDDRSCQQCGHECCRGHHESAGDLRDDAHGHSSGQADGGT